MSGLAAASGFPVPTGRENFASLKLSVIGMVGAMIPCQSQSSEHGQWFRFIRTRMEVTF